MSNSVVPVVRQPVPPAAGQSVAGSLERARWELAAMAGKLRTADRELAELRLRNTTLKADLKKEREKLRQVQRSDTYRLGRAAVGLVKHPVRTVPRLGRAVVRRIGKHRAGNAAAAAITAAPRPRTAPRLPVHLYVAIGLETETLRTFVTTLNQRVLVNADHRPVVVTDCPSFALLRNLGVILEYVPDRQTWLRHRPELPWDDVLSERLSWIYREHDAVRTLIVDRVHPPSLAELLR
jgi:hypothetical protein